MNGKDRLRVLHSRGDRHRHGEHIVDQQRAGHGQTRVGAEVGGGHLVVAATGRVGVHVLPVGGDHHQHHHRDQDGDLPGVPVRDQTGEGERQQDLVGGVGDRRQRVRGEDRQSDPLGQQGLAQLGAAEPPADDEALRDLGWVHVRHSNPAAHGTAPRLVLVHIVIMGCGRVGSTLARSLEKRGHTVAVIDQNTEAFRRLGPDFDGQTIKGVGFDREVLSRQASSGRRPSPRSRTATTPTSWPPGWCARPSTSTTWWPGSTTRAGPRCTSDWASPPSPPSAGRPTRCSVGCCPPAPSRSGATRPARSG